MPEILSNMKREQFLVHVSWELEISCTKKMLGNVSFVFR